MTFQEAHNLLSQCYRDELRDHAFGDREVTWRRQDGTEVAYGYFGESASVSIRNLQGADSLFEDNEARRLSVVGPVGTIERNDETGPDNYQDGQTLPGLTLDGVLKELTTPRKEN